MVHDPSQQASYLRQALAQDKRPLAFLIGAGCPVSVEVDAGGAKGPLIPDIAGLTVEIQKALKATPDAPLLDRLVAHFHEDGTVSPTVEDFLTHLRALRAVVGTQKVRSFTSSELDGLDNAISGAIVKIVERDLPFGATPYAVLASWVRAIARDHPVQLFTTNYDLLLEQALERAHVPYFDGFVGAHRPFFDPYAMEEDPLPSRWARLWKLHGSISWHRGPDGAVSRGAAGANGKQYVIHPSHLKYDESRRMPYLAMLDRLRAFCKRPGALLVSCGYSYRDNHLNEVVASGLRGNSNAAGFGLLFGKLADHAKALRLAEAHPNLSLLAHDEAVVGGRRASWMRKEPPEEGSPAPLAFSSTSAKQGQPSVTTFLLGDFARFGMFVEDLIQEHRVAIDAA